MTIVRIGIEPMFISATRQDEERAGHDDQPEGDPEGVVLDPAGLDALEAPAGADRRPRRGR